MRSLVLGLGALFVVTACGEPPNSIRTYTVAYTVDKDSISPTAVVTFDSVKYLDGNGGFVRVLNPGDSWGVAMSLSTGTEVEARVWGSASSGGLDAKLRVTWTISGVSTAGDSAFVTTAAPGAFNLSVERQSLP